MPDSELSPASSDVTHPPRPPPPALDSSMPQLDTLISHLVASKRSLSSINHVWRANEIVTAATETNDQQKVEKQQPISDEKVTPEPKSNELSTEKTMKTETIEEKSNIQAIQVESQKAEITSSQEKNSDELI